MHSFRSNPPSREVRPRPELIPSATGSRRVRGSGHHHIARDRTSRPLIMVEQILDQTGMAASTLGRMVAKDPRLVMDMRGGREPRPALIAEIAHLHCTVFGQREVSHA